MGEGAETETGTRRVVVAVAARMARVGGEREGRGKGGGGERHGDAVRGVCVWVGVCVCVLQDMETPYLGLHERAVTFDGLEHQSEIRSIPGLDLRDEAHTRTDIWICIIIYILSIII